MAESVRYKLTGRRAERPWISYAAERALYKLIEPHWSVLEFGSGMSTIWLARRCKRLTSIESDPGWYASVERRLQVANLWADCRFCQASNYGAFGELPAASFDLAIVDGCNRETEARAALAAVKPGGYIFYDNSDVQLADNMAALEILTAGARHTATFNDFAPPGVQVTESMLFCAHHVGSFASQ